MIGLEYKEKSDDRGAEGSEAMEDAEIIREAMEFMRLAEDAESTNRAHYQEATRFRHGEQWPPEIQQARQLSERPCLTINKTDAFCQQVVNQQRMQRPRIKVDPTGGRATKKIADVIKGMIRHIEQTNGGADLAYDTAFECEITGGWGYWRIMSEYVREDKFEQQLYLAPIDNPLSCYDDPNSIMPDGSDKQGFLIADFMSKAAFKLEYPGADDGANFAPGTTGDYSQWLNREQIRVAEFYKIRRKRDTLLRALDGTTAWMSELPKGYKVPEGTERRTSYRSKVWWYKLTALEVLDRRELPGRYIPVVKASGKREVIDGKRLLSGLVKNAMDPQRMGNFWTSAMTESVALAPKAKWVIAEGQDEGHESEWATANTNAKATLRYVPTDVNGNPAPPPQRVQPEPPPSGAMAMTATAWQDLSTVLGIIDPAQRISGNVSGKALRAERSQADNGTFHFYDNLTRAIRFTGIILLDLIPHYYYEPGRIVRIIGDDGQSKTETINQENPSPGEDTPGPVEAVLNDVTVGEYAVVMDTGPGFESKRIEATESMMPMMQNNQKLFDVAGDLVFRNLDFPGAETIADRLAAANPLAQIDENSEIPPGVQMKIKQMQQVIEQQGQQMQGMALELKHRGDLQQMKEEAATRRTLIQTTAQVHANDQDNAQWQRDTDSNTATKRHDTEVRALTALNVAEINAVRDLLRTKVNNAHDAVKLEREVDESKREVVAKSNETEQ